MNVLKTVGGRIAETDDSERVFSSSFTRTVDVKKLARLKPVAASMKV